MTHLEICNKIKSAKDAKDFVKGLDGIADAEEIDACTSLMDKYIYNLQKDLKECIKKEENKRNVE